MFLPREFKSKTIYSQSNPSDNYLKWIHRKTAGALEMGALAPGKTVPLITLFQYKARGLHGQSAWMNHHACLVCLLSGLTSHLSCFAGSALVQCLWRWPKLPVCPFQLPGSLSCWGESPTLGFWPSLCFFCGPSAPIPSSVQGFVDALCRGPSRGHCTFSTPPLTTSSVLEPISLTWCITPIRLTQLACVPLYLRGIHPSTPLIIVCWSSGWPTRGLQVFQLRVKILLSLTGQMGKLRCRKVKSLGQATQLVGIRAEIQTQSIRTSKCVLFNTYLKPFQGLAGGVEYWVHELTPNPWHITSRTLLIFM